MAGGFWGGMAQGFGQGQQLVENYREGQEKKRQRERQREGEALIDASFEMEGKDKDPNAPITTESVIAGLKDDARPGIFGVLRSKLDPQRAAAAAGLPTAAASAAVGGAPAGEAVQAGIPSAPLRVGSSTAAPAAHEPVGFASAEPGVGIPATAPAPASAGPGPDEVTEVDEVTVRPARPGKYSRTDALRMRIAGLYRQGNETAATALMPQLHAYQKEDANTELALGAVRGFGGIINVVDKNDPNGEWEYVPTDDPTKFTVSRNGEELGTWTVSEALDKARSLIEADPYLPERMSMTRSAADRAERQIANSEAVSRANQWYQRQNVIIAQGNQQLREAQVGLEAARTQSQLEGDAQVREQRALTIETARRSVEFYKKMAMPSEGWDPLTDTSFLATAYQLDAGVTDTDENGQRMTPNTTMAQAKLQAQKGRYYEAAAKYGAQVTPVKDAAGNVVDYKVEGGNLRLVGTPRGLAYLVVGARNEKGQQLYYPTLDEAELAARRLYEKRAKK